MDHNERELMSVELEEIITLEDLPKGQNTLHRGNDGNLYLKRNQDTNSKVSFSRTFRKWGSSRL
jgi:predicted transcriptional regulator